MSTDRTAVVTGASSGIGRATVTVLTTDGIHVRAGARRTDRLQTLASQTGASTMQFDVTDPGSVSHRRSRLALVALSGQRPSRL